MYSYSHYSLNELARGLVEQSLKNQVKFKYILGDRWFASISLKDVRAGTYTRLDKLGLNTSEARKVYLKDITFPVVVTPKVFKDGEAMLGDIYLVINALPCRVSALITFSTEGEILKLTIVL